MSVDLTQNSDDTGQNDSTSSGRSSLAEKLFAPIDIGMIVLFRVAFGAALVIEMYRYFTHGWIDREFVEPPIHFTYYGFWWVQPFPSPAISALLVCWYLILPDHGLATARTGY